MSTECLFGCTPEGRLKKKETARCLKMHTTCFPSCLYECFSLCPIINHFGSAHTFIFFCSGSTHRPLVLTHLSLPQMQPFFHYPSVTGVRSRCAARLLSRSCVPWRRAPNKIWVRLKNPNFFFCLPVTNLPAGGVLSFLVSYWLSLERLLQ